MATPKKEPAVTMKTPKVEAVKPETVMKVEDHQVNPVKAEKTEAADVTGVKKEESVPVKVNFGCGGGAFCR